MSGVKIYCMYYIENTLNRLNVLKGMSYSE